MSRCNASPCFRRRPFAAGGVHGGERKTTVAVLLLSLAVLLGGQPTESWADSGNPFDTQGGNAPAHGPLETPSGIDFGQVPAGMTARRTIVLTNHGTSPLTFSNFSVTGKDMGLSITDNDCERVGALQPEAKCSIVITLVNRAPTGSFAADLSIHHSGPDRLAVIPIKLASTAAVGGIGVPVFDGNGIDFGTVRIGTDHPVKTAILRNDGGDLKIASIHLSGGGQGLKIVRDDCAERDVLRRGQSCAVSVLWTPREAVDVNAEMIAEYGDGVVITPVVGKAIIDTQPKSGTGGGVLYLSRDSINFGELTTREDAVSRNVIMVNTGDKALTIQSVDLAGDPESLIIERSDCVHKSLEPGESCLMSLRWAPRVAMRLSGELVVVHTGLGGRAIIGIEGVSSIHRRGDQSVLPGDLGASGGGEVKSSPALSLPPPPDMAGKATDADDGMGLSGDQAYPAVNEASAQTAFADMDMPVLVRCGVIGNYALLKSKKSILRVRSGGSIKAGGMVYDVIIRGGDVFIRDKRGEEAPVLPAVSLLRNVCGSVFPSAKGGDQQGAPFAGGGEQKLSAESK